MCFDSARCVSQYVRTLGLVFIDIARCVSHYVRTLGLVFIDSARCVSHYVRTLGLVFIVSARCVSQYVLQYSCDEEHPNSHASQQTGAVSQSCCQHKLLLLPLLCIGCIDTNTDLNCAVALLNCVCQNLFVQHYRD